METEFGRYLLTERLGTGSLTDAYRAKSFGVEGFEKGIVVKRVLPSRADLPGLIEAFVDFAKASLALSHANVAQVIDLGKATAAIPGERGAREHTFIATELVDGIDVRLLLHHVREKKVAIPLGLALYVAAEVAKALDHAHKRRSGAVLHGPVTPQSVLVSWEGEVKVSDFAIHRALAAVRFEPDEERALPYLSPEQALHRPLRVESDIFSLGILLHELVTSESPFLGADRDATLGKIALGSPKPLSSSRSSVPASLDRLVARMLDADPTRRFTDAGSLHEEIVALGYALGLGPSPVEMAEFVSRLCRYGTAPGRAEDDVALSLAEATPGPSQVARAEKREATFFVVAGPDASKSDVLERIERAGGVVLSSDGAEARAVFGLVEADGRDTEAAVDVGIALVGGTEERGVGIDLGRVTADERGVVVADVDLVAAFSDAARLANGKQGVVRLTKAAGRVVERDFDLEIDPEREDALRAIKRLTEIVAPGRFIGRRAEIERIGRLFSRCLRGEQVRAVVEGARGIGKTRLVSEIGRRLAKLPSGADFHRASCPRDLTGSPTPLGGIREVARAVLVSADRPRGRSPDDGEATPPSLDEADVVRRLRLLGLDELDTKEIVALTLTEAATRSEEATSRALGRALERLSRDRAIVIALDDVQFLDAASVRVLSAIGRDHPSARILWLLVGRRLDAPIGAEAESIRVGPLDDSEVAVLTASLLGARVLPPDLVAYLAERADRNPLLVELIVKELTDAALVTVRQGVAEADLGRASVPRTLRALIEGRLARLGHSGSPGSGREVLRALAILGDAASIDEVAAFLGAPVESIRSVLDDPEVAALVSNGRLAGGLSDVILETIPEDERKRAHARAGELIEGLGERTGDRIERVALHLAASGDGSTAARRFADAASLFASPSRERGARADRAARAAARALQAATLDEVPAAELGGWLSVLANAVVESRARVGFIDLAATVIERIDASGEISDRVKARLDVARIAAVEGAFEQAEIGLAQARDLATDPALRARVIAAEVEVAERSGEIARGCEAARALQGLGLPIDARVLLDAATLFAAGRSFDEANGAIEAAYEIGLGDTALLRASVEASRARVLLTAGDAPGAQRTSLLAADLAEAHDSLFDVASARLTLAEAHIALERPERAYAAYVEALEAAEAAGFERLAMLARAGLSYLEGIRARLGRSAGAEATLGRLVLEAEARGLLADALRMRLLSGKLLLARGAKVEARGELEKTAKTASELGHRALADEATTAASRCD